MNLKRYFLFYLYVVLNHVAFSQIVNEGTLKIKPSTVVYFDNEYTNKSTGTHDNDGDLYVNNNFINNGITSSNAGTTFFKSATSDILTISGTTKNLNLYNLEVNLTNATKKGVSVEDNFGLIVKNAVNLVSGDLRLIGDAQLVQTHSGVGINSSTTGKLLKDRQGTKSAYAYNYWSSPVNNNGTYKLSQVLFDGTDSGLNSFTPILVTYNSGSPYNGIPSIVDGSDNVTTSLKINTTWLYKYTQGNGGAYADWIKINQNTALNPGEGFTMKGTNTLNPYQNYVFKGVPNDGQFSFSINAGESTLLGNPYPSAIDSNIFITDNLTLIDVLYFWSDGGTTSHDLSNYLGGYSYRNLTAGTLPSVASGLIAGVGNLTGITPPTRYMAVGQGFFVGASANGTLVFNNSQRIFKTESSSESYFYRANTEKSNQQKSSDPDSFIWIGYEGPLGFHRQLALGFLPGSPADLNYNLGYDAIMIDPRVDEMFYIIEGDLTKKYVIQGVGAYDNLYEFPLGLNVSTTDTHTIILDAVDNFSDPIYIKDNVLNTTHNLKDSNYTFSLPAGNYLDRFSVVFQPITLGIDDITKKELFVYYNGENNIIIKNKNNLNLTKIIIYNMLGQKVKQVNNSLLNLPEIKIPFAFSEGEYIVAIETNEGKLSYEIIKG